MRCRLSSPAMMDPPRASPYHVALGARRVIPSSPRDCAPYLVADRGSCVCTTRPFEKSMTAEGQAAGARLAITGSSFARVDALAGTRRVRALLRVAMHVGAAALARRPRTRHDRRRGRSTLLRSLHAAARSGACEALVGARDWSVGPLLPLLRLLVALDETALTILWHESLSAHAVKMVRVHPRAKRRAGGRSHVRKSSEQRSEERRCRLERRARRRPGASGLEGPDLTVLIRRSSMSPPMAGVYLSTGLINFWAAITIRRQGTLIYLLALGVFFAGIGRLVSISRVGLPEPRIVWLAYLIPELSLPVIIAISQRARSRSAAVPAS